MSRWALHAARVGYIISAHKIVEWKPLRVNLEYWKCGGKITLKLFLKRKCVVMVDGPDWPKIMFRGGLTVGKPSGSAGRAFSSFSF
jgi:hypothetical protein